MKTNPNNCNSGPWRKLMPIALVVTLLSSCNPDEPIIIPADNTGTNRKLVLFRYENYNSTYKVNKLGTSIGDLVDEGLLPEWKYATGVEAGRKWLVLHDDDKEFRIRKVYSNGALGDITCQQKWNSNYETLVGFHVGDKGFIFGQDSYDRKWFIQQIMPDGKLEDNELNSGTWANYYKTAVPVYLNGTTFLFFQNEKADHYWFMTRVDESGNMTDVDDGHWGYFWNPVSFAELNGKGFLCGEYKDNLGRGQWFVQIVNGDGTLGAETDRGVWDGYFNALAGFNIDGHTYIYGASSEQSGLLGGDNHTMIQELTPEGKLGIKTTEFTMDEPYFAGIPYTVLENPGSFRYTVGWDLSASALAPAGGWSTLYSDPWNGDTKFGGGAALANIDRDAGGLLDAVMMGIQDVNGGDRYYYKVAWNLDSKGKATGWTQTIFGPYVGQMLSGGGADIADIDGNGVPDLMLMVVDNPEYGNVFWYNIGWNLGTDGKAASWSETFQVGGLGYDNAGGGVALGDIDKNGMVDAVFVAVDDPEQGNSFWYAIGQNLDKNGKAQMWTNHVVAPCNLGWETAGGGAALADIDGNGKPDLVLTAIDNAKGQNSFWCFIGWDIDINGNVTGWSEKFPGPSVGWMTTGGGTAIGDINKNGRPDLFLMSVDDPYGKD